MKTTVDYEISFRGNKKDFKEFEKLLIDRFVDLKMMRQWDDINDENNPPSGVIHWRKMKQLKIYTVLENMGESK